MKNVQFEGQTKTKLGNPEARTPVEAVVNEGLRALIAQPKNKKVFDEIVKKAQNAARVRIATPAGKGERPRQKQHRFFAARRKLAACSGRTPEKK